MDQPINDQHNCAAAPQGRNKKLLGQELSYCFKREERKPLNFRLLFLLSSSFSMRDPFHGGDAKRLVVWLAYLWSLPPLTPRLLPGVKKCLNRVEKETRIQLMNGANLERKFTKGFNTRQGVSYSNQNQVHNGQILQVYFLEQINIIKVPFIL